MVYGAFEVNTFYSWDPKCHSAIHAEAPLCIQLIALALRFKGLVLPSSLLDSYSPNLIPALCAGKWPPLLPIAASCCSATGCLFSCFRFWLLLQPCQLGSQLSQLLCSMVPCCQGNQRQTMRYSKGQLPPMHCLVIKVHTFPGSCSCVLPLVTLLTTLPSDSLACGILNPLLVIPLAAFDYASTVSALLLPVWDYTGDQDLEIFLQQSTNLLVGLRMKSRGFFRLCRLYPETNA